jgi:tRNA dimethylallyltransferase
MSHEPYVIFLMGPTASGKSRIALDLTRELPCDVISVDSALVYRGMDIGTAKPSPAVLSAVPHRLIDIRDPAEVYSAADFRNDALAEIRRSVAAGRIPLLVGGTMLYFRALQSGLSSLPSADASVRRRLMETAQALGWKALHEKIREIDPACADRVHPNDRQRILRALEIYEIQGENWTRLCAESRSEAFPYRVVKIVLAPDQRAVLHERIARRFDEMLAQGFVEEVAGLYRRGDLNSDMPSMRAVGYRQIWNYLAGRGSYQHMRERAVAATRQFAKRQFTWLRADEQAYWIDSSGGNPAGEVLKYVHGQTL